MSITTPDLSRIILSNPSLLDAQALKMPKYGAPRSWIQLAKTGSFVSNRYGQFSITRDDLRQMLHNFRTVTPKAPTELPIDYDHLSMAPSKPGDGVAAGWLKDIELRADGDEIWGLVEWTPRAAEQIKGGEYRFVSPSFVTDYTDKSGTKVGTTLLAAAITNHPFLEGMQALTLYNFSAMGDLALGAAAEAPATTVRHLADVGQRVTFRPDAERTPELTDEERRQTFVVRATIGDGDNQFVRLATLNGDEFGWFQVTQLAPAKAPAPDADPTSVSQPQEVQMNAETMSPKTIQAARAFEKRVLALSQKHTMRDAISLATTHDPDGADAYRRLGIETETDRTPEAPPVLSLSERWTGHRPAQSWAASHKARR